MQIVCFNIANRHYRQVGVLSKSPYSLGQKTCCELFSIRELAEVKLSMCAGVMGVYKPKQCSIFESGMPISAANRL